MRSILSPVPNVYIEDNEFKLYEDWHQSYMIAREKHGFLLAWLLALVEQGKPVINPPQFGTVSLLKPLQIFKLQQKGFPTPRTLVTNDPREAAEFVKEVGRAVAKPILGGAYCERMTEDAISRLPSIAGSPIILQEEIEGPDIRVTAVKGRILSAVSIHSDSVDFRASEAYERNEAIMASVELSEATTRLCLEAMDAIGLEFTSIDLKRTGPDDHVILELNFSPAFLWIETRTGHEISAGVAEYLIQRAGDRTITGSKRENFFHYGVPKPSQAFGAP